MMNFGLLAAEIGLKPNSIALASSELAPNMFGAGSKLKFGLTSSLLAAN